MYPASITSRPVRWFIAEKRLAVSERVVDIVVGEHYKDEFTSINPNRMVPVLEAGALRLTEASAILKYLATRFEAPEYPVVLDQRAKVDEAMDWFNTQLSRDFLHEFVYPQVFPHHKRATDAQNAATIAWGREKARGWFEILDGHLLGKSAYVANDRISIADYLGASFVAAGEMIGCTFEAYPNVQRWLANLQQLPHWAPVNATLCRFASQLAGTQFVRL